MKPSELQMLATLQHKADLWDALTALPYGTHLEYSANTGKWHLQLLDHGFDYAGRLDVVVLAVRRFMMRQRKQTERK